MSGADEASEHETAKSRMEALIRAMRRPKAVRGTMGGGGDAAEVDEDRLAEVARRAVMRPVRDASGGGVQESAVGQPVHLERGAVIGRYMVLRELGAGGMGVVYAAYDPELDRKVALKVVAPGMMGEEGRTRLLREAQALAKLSHRNVVAIHDVGTMGEQVWLAMELLRGQTLREWLREPRDWRDVLAVMRKAGRGLAAAHAAGLLHRDFKPENVMVGKKGGVKVMDFGLARARGQEDALASEESVRAAVPVVDTLAMGVTQTGVMVGTPHYMAPEQLVGAEVTAAADQFSFCVTLWEGWCGERPFGEGTLERHVEAVVAGKVREPAKRRGGPGWLRRLCERGLNVRPDQRFASMDELLDALAKGRTRARVRMALGVVGALTVIGVGVEGYQRLDVARRAAACQASGDEVQGAWNEERKLALHDAIVGTGASQAPTTAEKVMPWLERQAEAWREARVEACLDAEVRDRWDPETYDRSLWCLEERWIDLQSLVDELTAADASMLNKAVQAAVGLGSVAPCRNTDALTAHVPPNEEDREALRAVRADLIHAASLERLGRYDEGMKLARASLERAQALASRPLLAQARYRVGILLERQGAYGDAEKMLEDAYFEAAQLNASRVVFGAAVQLGAVEDRLARYDEGKRWGRHAEVALTSTVDAEGLESARLFVTLARIHESTGNYAQAREFNERALAIQEAALGPEHPNVAATLNNLGLVHAATGAREEAKALYERALAIKERAEGPEHPEVIKIVNNLAGIHLDNGAYEQAKALYERVLAVDEATLGPEHPRTAQVLSNLAEVYRATGVYEEAKALHQRALSIREKRLGSRHPEVAASLDNLGILYSTSGAHEEAKSHFEQALVIRESVLGPAHPKLAGTLGNLGSAHFTSGEYEEAKVYFERALAIVEATRGPKHPAVADALNNVGNSLAVSGAHEEAKGHYERALAIVEEARGPAHPRVAMSLDNLAFVHTAMGAHDEAKGLYERALAIREKAQGPQHPAVAYSLEGLARVALVQGRPVDALTLAQRAVSVRERGTVAPEDLADARFVLARALWEAPVDGGRDRARAKALAGQARDAFREVGKARAKELVEAERWLEDHAEAQ